MKIRYLITICLFITSYAGYSNADVKVGIGTGVNTAYSRGYGGMIAIPIRTGPSFMFEPFFGIYTTNEEADNNLPNYSEYDMDDYNIGLGMYGISSINNSDFEIYYGGTFGASKGESNRNRKYTNNPGSSNYVLSSDVSKRTEYFVMPILGISYTVNENFSLSIDVGLGYRWGTEDDTKKSTQYTNNVPNAVTIDRQSTKNISGTRTGTRLLFRYLF